jgi:hypothetical protein
VTGSFDREPSNSVEQTFTVVVVGFMIAPEKNENGREGGAHLSVAARAAEQARE